MEAFGFGFLVLAEHYKGSNEGFIIDLGGQTIPYLLPAGILSFHILQKFSNQPEHGG